MNTFEHEIENIVEVFKGKCSGVVVFERRAYAGDNHLMFTIITEDDENWFVSKTNQKSLFWLNDLREVLDRVDAWRKTDTVVRTA